MNRLLLLCTLSDLSSTLRTLHEAAEWERLRADIARLRARAGLDVADEPVAKEGGQ